MNRHAFSLIELLVTMTIIMVLGSILLPAAQSVRKKGRQVICMSNLRQMGLALNMYRDEHDDVYPPANALGMNLNYHQAVAPYLKTQTQLIVGAQRLTNAFLCPEVWNRYKQTQPDLWGYGYNESISRDAYFWVPPIYPYVGTDPSYRMVSAAALVPQPPRKIAMVCNVNGNKWSYDASGWDLWTQTDLWEIKPPEGIHNGRDNYLYCDGHVESRDLNEHDVVNAAWYANVKTSPYQY